MLLIDPGKPTNEIEFYIKQKISYAEQAREEGRTFAAAYKLKVAISMAAEINKPELVAEALGHRIDCWKHMYQSSKEPRYLGKMKADIIRGLALKVSLETQAIFHLRKGDLLTFQKRWKDANEEYLLAYEMIGTGKPEQAEFLGHWGNSFAPIGEYEKAARLVNDARMMLLKMKDVEPKQKLVIESGLLLFSSKIALQMRHIEEAYQDAKNGLTKARELRDKYGMPKRLDQFYRQLPLGKVLQSIFERSFNP